MDYINVVERFKIFRDELREAILKEELLGKEPWVTLFNDINELVVILDDPIIAEPLDNLKVKHSLTDSYIDNSGIGSIILKLYQDGIDIDTICRTLSVQGHKIKPNDIRDWIDRYNNAPISTKPAIVRGSVFETRNRLEEIHLLIHNHLDYIKEVDDELFTKSRTTKAQVYTEALRELRQLYKDANTLLSTIQQLKSIKEFQEVVLESISGISPSTYNQIVKALKERKALMSAIIPD